MRLCAFSFGPSTAWLLLTASAQGQEITRSRQVVESAVGQVTQDQITKNSQGDIKPMGRLNSRIANRVQNRIHNRIDRFYDPTANTTSPFEVAAEQTTRGQPPR